MKQRIIPTLILLLGSLLHGSEVNIPACLLSYKSGPQQYVLIVEKSSQTLYVYSNYQAEPLERFLITSGKESGQKQSEGDMRTPEGIYFSRRVITGDDLPKADDYGEKAFTLNYPNPIDKFENRSGSGIWLHGAFDTEKTDDPNNSRGCVVLSNSDMMKVSRYMFLNQTPIIIYDTIEYVGLDRIKEKREEFINYLSDWKTAWENKDITNYIGSYDPGFYYNRMDLKAFEVYKKRLNKTYRFIKVEISKINVYHFDNYFFVMFNQLYVSNLNDFHHKKIQYWKEHNFGARIAYEFSMALPSPRKIEISKGNYVSLNQFRREYQGQSKPKPDTVNYKPGAVNVSNISVTGNSVRLSLSQTGANRKIRVIPVLLLKHEGETEYSTLPGIRLREGVPQDYYKGIRLEGPRNNVKMLKQPDFDLKSITLFVINNNNSFEQIVTYFLNK